MRSVLRIASVISIEITVATAAMLSSLRSVEADTSPCACLERSPPVAATGTNQSVPQPINEQVLRSTFFADAADKGIYFRLFLNEEIAANPAGGIDQGITASQYVTFGTDIDFERLVGWQGGALHALVIAESSRGLSKEYIGGGVDAQENFSPFDFVRFLNFTLEQNISISDDAKLNLQAGRMSVTPTFATSQLTCLFMNHAFCGVLYGLPESTAAAPAPLSTWGGRVRLNLTPKIYVQFGGFAIDGNIFSPGTEIFDWGTGRVTGVDYLWEAGYESTFKNASYPGYYRIGFSYLDAPSNDVFLNSAGLPIITFGGTPLTHHGDTAFYMTAGQVIWRPDKVTHRYLALFGSIYYNFEDSNAIQYTLKGGIVKTGTFASRPSDTLDLGVAMIGFSSKEIDFLSAARRAGGGSGRVPSQEVVLEVNYGYQVAPGVVVRPNLQYIINPDSRYTPNFRRDIPNAFVVGLQINVAADTFFRLPHIGQ
jgi:porin